MRFAKALASLRLWYAKPCGVVDTATVVGTKPQASFIAAHQALKTVKGRTTSRTMYQMFHICIIPDMVAAEQFVALERMAGMGLEPKKV